jgi:hypothetical protein
MRNEETLCGKFFSAETLKQKRNDEIKVRVGEEKEKTREGCFVTMQV